MDYKCNLKSRKNFGNTNNRHVCHFILQKRELWKLIEHGETLSYTVNKLGEVWETKFNILTYALVVLQEIGPLELLMCAYIIYYVSYFD